MNEMNKKYIFVYYKANDKCVAYDENAQFILILIFFPFSV